ncbi:alpha/beta fold hydrolase [Roseivirga sp. E12]|uniref:alpha/beta fold hydrolase n=1 Tax=Roseivirga sp. E12 TaxID=2819237 RepID=UPI001ABBEC59|nr:alpha/beta fold hydrolase [Roseivirga sp. E12]MBO3697755.1 alpha/beta fold hydrolase [Roseivirga sp. E12]
MKLLKAYLSFLDTFAPTIAAKKVYKVMSNPRIKKLRDFENEVLDQSIKKTIRFNKFDIQTYYWGVLDRPVALLVHGWEGQAGNFGGIVPTLLKKGYQVISFDAPSHGYSSKGPTNMFEYIELVSELFREHQPEYVLSHSFGSIASAVALTENQHLDISQWTIVTSPFSFRERLEGIRQMVDVTDRTISRLIRQIEEDTKELVDDLSMEKYCAKISNVDQIKIIHSVDDKILPIQSSKQVHNHLPKAEMIELKGLGHYRILWSDELRKIIKED